MGRCAGLLCRILGSYLSWFSRYFLVRLPPGICLSIIGKAPATIVAASRLLTLDAKIARQEAVTKNKNEFGGAIATCDLRLLKPFPALQSAIPAAPRSRSRIR